MYIYFIFAYLISIVFTLFIMFLFEKKILISSNKAKFDHFRNKKYTVEVFGAKQSRKDQLELTEQLIRDRVIDQEHLYTSFYIGKNFK